MNYTKEYILKDINNKVKNYFNDYRNYENLAIELDQSTVDIDKLEDIYNEMLKDVRSVDWLAINEDNINKKWIIEELLTFNLLYNLINYSDDYKIDFNYIIYEWLKNTIQKELLKCFDNYDCIEFTEIMLNEFKNSCSWRLESLYTIWYETYNLAIKNFNIDVVIDELITEAIDVIKNNLNCYEMLTMLKICEDKIPLNFESITQLTNLKDIKDYNELIASIIESWN